jgi:hypothetical protein
MRIPSSCSCGGRALVYCTIRHASFVVRYRRCDSCHQTSKSIQLKKFLSSKHILDVATVDADTLGVSHITGAIQNDKNDR